MSSRALFAHGRLWGGAVVLEKDGARNPNWKGGDFEKVCERCAAPFTVKYGRKDRARFCSLPCFNLWQAEHKVGLGKKRPGTGRKGIPRVPRISIPCESCGTEMVLAQGQAGRRKYCSAACSLKGRLASVRVYSRCKRGRRPDLGAVHFRSSWEANYARFLNLLVKRGELVRWEYEADTFWFEKIRRGVRSYTPDFKLHRTDGSVEYVEVKGWMDKKSATKIKRMRIYHPKVQFRVVSAKEYREIAKKVGPFIDGWEGGFR